MPHHGQDVPQEILDALTKLTDRTYPEGKLNADDRGALGIAVGEEGGKVKIMFGEPTAWVACGPEQALLLAESISVIARKIQLK